jgi:hypothetical protein
MMEQKPNVKESVSAWNGTKVAPPQWQSPSRRHVASTTTEQQNIQTVKKPEHDKAGTTPEQPASLKHRISFKCIKDNPFLVADREKRSNVTMVIQKTNPGVNEVRIHRNLRESLHADDVNQAEQIMKHLVSGSAVEGADVEQTNRTVLGASPLSAYSVAQTATLGCQRQRVRSHPNSHSLSDDVTMVVSPGDHRHALGKDILDTSDSNAQPHPLGSDVEVKHLNITNGHDIGGDASTTVSRKARRHPLLGAINPSMGQNGSRFVGQDEPTTAASIASTKHIDHDVEDKEILPEENRSVSKSTVIGIASTGKEVS